MHVIITSLGPAVTDHKQWIYQRGHIYSCELMQCFTSNLCKMHSASLFQAATVIIFFLFHIKHKGEGMTHGKLRSGGSLSSILLPKSTQLVWLLPYVHDLLMLLSWLYFNNLHPTHMYTHAPCKHAHRMGEHNWKSKDKKTLVSKYDFILHQAVT